MSNVHTAVIPSFPTSPPGRLSWWRSDSNFQDWEEATYGKSLASIVCLHCKVRHGLFAPRQGIGMVNQMHLWARANADLRVFLEALAKVWGPYRRHGLYLTNMMSRFLGDHSYEGSIIQVKLDESKAASRLRVRQKSSEASPHAAGWVPACDPGNHWLHCKT